MTPESTEEQLRQHIALLEARDAAQVKTIAFFVQEMERMARERATTHAVPETE